MRANLLILLLVFAAKAALCQTVAPLRSGSWNDKTVWNTGKVPTSSDVVFIPAGIQVTINISAIAKALIADSGDVTFSNSSSLAVEDLEIKGNGSFSSGTRPVSVANDLTIGDRAAFSSTTGNVTVKGTSTIKDAATFSSTSGTLTFGGLTLKDNATFSANNSTLVVQGDWHNTSANAFDSGTSTVKFKASGNSVRMLRSVEPLVFYNLILENEASIALSNSFTVKGSYTQTGAALDLRGNTVTVEAQQTKTTVNLTNCSITSSVAGGMVKIVDPQEHRTVTTTINGLTIGQENNWVDLEVRSGRICFSNSTFYGNITFIKTHNSDDVCNAGNMVHGNAFIKAEANSARWRMGDSGSVGDVYMGDVYYEALANSSNSNNNFIVGVSTTGNKYYGTTTFRSTTMGGIYAGRSNGRANSEIHFYGPVKVFVEYTGNVNFAEASSTRPNVITFEDVVELNSTETSTGDINIGFNNYSNIKLVNKGRIITGTAGVLGATKVSFMNLKQHNEHATNLTLSGTSNLAMGTVSAPNAILGNFSATAPAITVSGNTFGKAATFKTPGSYTASDNTFLGAATLEALTLKSTRDTYSDAVVTANTIDFSTGRVNGGFSGNATASFKSTASNYGKNALINAGGSVELATSTYSGIVTATAGTSFKSSNSNYSRPVTFSATSTAEVNSSVFDDAITVVGGIVKSTNSTYKGSSSFEQNGTSSPSNVWHSNNFAADVTITNSGSLAWALNTDSSKPNTYLGNVTFRNIGTGTLQPLYTGIAYFHKNVFMQNTLRLGGTAEMAGNGTQEVRGLNNAEVQFSNLKLNKPDGTLVLGSPVQVTTQLNLQQGLVQSSTQNILTLGTSASAINASSQSHVVGPLVKTFSNQTSFTFPIGEGAVYAPLTVASASKGTHTFTAQYKREQPFNRDSKVTASDYISPCEYWLLNRTGSTTAANITMNWNENSCDVRNEPGYMRLASYDGSKWASSATTNTASSGTFHNGSITVSNVSTFGAITLASTVQPIPLPVELVYFKAARSGKHVVLEWATAMEENNDFFTIEKSQDGRNFKELRQVPGVGTTQVKQVYSQTDEQAYSGIAYYRLKQTDFDGTFTYSKVVAVQALSQEQQVLAVYPNPATEQVNISGEEEIEEVLLQDMQGRTLALHKPGSAASQVTVPLTNVSKGIYTLTIRYKSSKTTSRKLVKS